MKQGYGVQIWPDGSKYEGEWFENKAHGNGKFTHSNNDVYHGEWKDDKVDGFGIYIHHDGGRY